jgi:hypothetical protein
VRDRAVEIAAAIPLPRPRPGDTADKNDESEHEKKE